MKKLMRDKRGNALIIAAGALPLVIGSAGLASDTIQWALWKRQLQRAADSAALAAVYDRIAHDGSTANVSAAVTNDLGRHNHTNITLLGGFPQLAYPSGTNWTNPVRVTLALQNRLGFSSVFMSSPPIITTSATAATVATGVYCVVSLIDTADTGIRATGDGDIDLGCGMITNSTSLTAAIATGSSHVNATPVAAVGDIQNSDNWGGAELLPFTVKQKDPFGEVEPDTSSCSSPKKLTETSASIVPGCYSSIDLNGPVNLPSGTYIIDGGDLNFGNKANITCTGCTFVLTNSDPSETATIGGVDFNADAHIDLSAPNDAGNPYDGIVIYQDRRAESGPSKVNKINGNASSVIAGAFYFPKQQLQINGGAGLEFTCGQFVAYIVEFSGNSGITNTCTGGYGDDVIMGQHVRLVA